MLENSRLSVVFITRKLEREIDNIKIYARVTVDGKRAEFSLNREFPVSLWDEKRKRGKGFSKYVISVNKYLIKFLLDYMRHIGSFYKRRLKLLLRE